MYFNLREITSIQKTKIKKVYQLSESDFRSGSWCSNKDIVPEGSYVELEYKSRNRILIVHNTTNWKIKSINEAEMAKQKKLLEDK